MTEPDEALLWAREDSVSKTYAQTYALARAYRAGQAASAERIKALEGVAGEVIEDYDQMAGSVRSNTMEKLRNIIKGERDASS